MVGSRLMFYEYAESWLGRQQSERRAARFPEVSAGSQGAVAGQKVTLFSGKVLVLRVNYRSSPDPDSAIAGRPMKHVRIIPWRWYRRRSISSHCRLCSTNARWRLIQVLFSSTGGGGPPAPSLDAR
jgi:hypothetical protein